MFTLESVNHLVGIGALLMQVLTLIFLGVYLTRNKYPAAADIATSVGGAGLWMAFLASTGAMGMSLYYSDVLGILPCGLCWLMRIFMFSQPVLVAVALYKKDRTIADYSIALSAFGFVIGLYNHYLQMGGNSLVPCPASGAGDCAQRFLFEFNYITFPLVGASLFAFLIVVMLFVRRSAK